MSIKKCLFFFFHSDDVFANLKGRLGNGFTAHFHYLQEIFFVVYF